MYKNHEMKSMIESLKSDLADHQEVEKELAKRSHFCQKVIEKYTDQIKDLKNEIQEGENRHKMQQQKAKSNTEQ